MRCDVCHKTLRPEDAYEDSAGIELRIHKGCIDSATYDDLVQPDYRDTATDTRIAFLQPTQKANADLANAATVPPSVKCVLCGQPASQGDTFKLSDGRTIPVHALCIADLRQKLSQNSQETRQETPMGKATTREIPRLGTEAMSKTFGAMLDKQQEEYRKAHLEAVAAAEDAHREAMATLEYQDRIRPSRRLRGTCC